VSGLKDSVRAHINANPELVLRASQVADKIHEVAEANGFTGGYVLGIACAMLREEGYTDEQINTIVQTILSAGLEQLNEPSS